MLTADQILAAFDLLARELMRDGVSGEVFVVGGAAMVLAYGAREATKDVDAVFAPKNGVYEAAKRVAATIGLPDGWLNDAVKGFIDREDPEAQTVFDKPGLHVSAASPRYMLAMKLLAGRLEEDVDDVRFLVNRLGLTSPDEVLSVVTSAYPPSRILPRTRYMVEEMFGSVSDT